MTLTEIWENVFRALGLLLIISSGISVLFLWIVEWQALLFLGTFLYAFLGYICLTHRKKIARFIVKK